MCVQGHGDDASWVLTQAGYDMVETPVCVVISGSVFVPTARFPPGTQDSGLVFLGSSESLCARVPPPRMTSINGYEIELRQLHAMELLQGATFVGNSHGGTCGDHFLLCIVNFLVKCLSKRQVTLTACQLKVLPTCDLRESQEDSGEVWHGQRAVSESK